MANLSSSDQELIRDYLNGCEKSFEILLKRNKDRIFGYIYSKVRNHDLANDIFQDVFIKVIRTLKNGNYNEKGKFLPWVLTISHNMVVDHFRKGQKMQMVSESRSKNEDFNIFSVLRLTDVNAEDKMIKTQIEEDVIRLVHHLPKEQREVLEYRIFKGMSFKDIADKKEISINTAFGL